MSDIDEDEVIHLDLVGKRKVYSEEAYSKVTAERDRLREALEKILDPEKAGVVTYEIGVIQDIARAALQEATE